MLLCEKKTIYQNTLVKAIMPKRVATTRKIARPSATKFTVGTKRKFGNRLFQVRTRNTPKTLKRTKYWAACATNKPKLRKTKPVLRGGGKNEVIKALEEIAQFGDIGEVCKQNRLLAGYVTQLNTYIKHLLGKIARGYDKAIEAFLSGYDEMVNTTGLVEFEGTPGGQAQKTIKAVIDFYSSDKKRSSNFYCKCYKAQASIAFAQDDNVYEAVRATTAWPVTKIALNNNFLLLDAKFSNVGKITNLVGHAVLWNPPSE